MQLVSAILKVKKHYGTATHSTGHCLKISAYQ